MERLRITWDVLNRLGFGEYHDDNGYSGGRTLHLGDETSMWIIEVEAQEDVYEGYANMMRYTEPLYKPEQYYYCSSYNNIENVNYSIDLNYIEDLYECVEKMYPQYMISFLNKCKKANMMPYITEYLQSDKTLNKPVYTVRQMTDMVSLTWNWALNNPTNHFPPRPIEWDNAISIKENLDRHNESMPLLREIHPKIKELIDSNIF